MFHYPHGDLHELNLDWILEQWKKFKDSFTNTFTASSETLTAGSTPNVTVSFDSGTGIYDFHFGLPEAGEPTQTEIGYQVGTSPSTPPTGTWQTSPPVVPQGQYLWTKNKVVYNTGYYFSFYTVARQGIDGNPVLKITGTIPAGTTYTISDTRITADMEVIECVFGTPHNVTGDVNWTTSAGSVTFTSTFTGSTTVNCYLVKVV